MSRLYEYRVVVLSVHDGDTLRADFDLGRYVHNVDTDCRLAGVDAPELKARQSDPDGLGEQARAAVRSWLATHPGPYTARTVKDTTEKYGRFLIAALVAADGHELIADQTAAGWLKPYTGSGPKPTWP